MKAFHVAVASVFVLGSMSAGAAPSAAELERLGGDLTPVGALRSANKDGSVPAWAGATSKPASGWSVGKPRAEASHFKSEKPLFAIDAGNVDKYADNLTPSQIAMIKQVKGFKMNVYPSHRECSYPDFVLENTRAGAIKAAIGKDGWSLAEAQLPGIPFPVPKTGVEVLWNYLMRYQGVGYTIETGATTVSPPPGGGSSIITVWESAAFFPWGARGAVTTAQVKDIQQGYFYGYREPPALAGQALVQTFFFSQNAESFYYFTGQRRVRRLPSYSYDAPIIGFENQLANDSLSLFYGNPDRFDWRLVGKKEVYVPYNNLDMVSPSIKRQGTDQPFVDNEVRRYELHRVWVVEGTVKQGTRHSTPKKVFYFDEDTYLAVLGEDYDAKGALWHHKESAVYPAWEIGACSNTGLMYQHDFSNGRYVTDNNLSGGRSQIRFFSEPGSEKKMRMDFYTSDNLRTISDR